MVAALLLHHPPCLQFNVPGPWQGQKQDQERTGQVELHFGEVPAQGQGKRARSKRASESQRQSAHLPLMWPSWSHDLQLPCPEDCGGAPKRKTAPTESTVGDVEHGHVIFTDDHGCERHDCAMLDPGASAFLSGYGPFLCATC